eukprot:m.421816 g.421816  ORF g.421816 m.421816 type:complete len:603 (-) comp35011_c0_seq1:22-1830(-)
MAAAGIVTHFRECRVHCEDAVLQAVADHLAIVGMVALGTLYGTAANRNVWKLDDLPEEVRGVKGIEGLLNFLNRVDRSTTVPQALGLSPGVDLAAMQQVPADRSIRVQVLCSDEITAVELPQYDALVKQVVGQSLPQPLPELVLLPPRVFSSRINAIQLAEDADFVVLDYRCVLQGHHLSLLREIPQLRPVVILARELRAGLAANEVPTSNSLVWRIVPGVAAGGAPPGGQLAMVPHNDLCALFIGHIRTCHIGPELAAGLRKADILKSPPSRMFRVVTYLPRLIGMMGSLPKPPDPDAPLEFNTYVAHPTDEDRPPLTSVKVVSVFNSSARPKYLECTVADPAAPKVPLIFKTGDILVGDQICMGLLEAMNAIWRHTGLGYTWNEHLSFIEAVTYRVSVDSANIRNGFLEFVGGTQPVWAVADESSFLFPNPHDNIMGATAAGKPGGSSFVPHVATAVGAFVGMFVLAIGDRHQHNMLFTQDGRYISIDFGFEFGLTTKVVDAPDFPIPIALYNHLNDANGTWLDFVQLCTKAVIALQPYKAHLIALAERASPSPEFRKRVKETLEHRLSMSATDIASLVEHGPTSPRKWLKNRIHAMGQQ